MIQAVLYSSYEQSSRDFLSQIPEGVPAYDWYTSDLSAYTGPGVSQFPSICMTVWASGASGNAVGLYTSSTNWADVTAASIGIDTGFGLDNQALLSNVGQWGSYVNGQLVTGPNLPAFEAAIFADLTISPGAKLNLPLTYPLLEKFAQANPVLCQQYWQLLKLTAPVWLDSTTISLVEGYATQFGVPIV